MGQGFTESLTILNHDSAPLALEVRISSASDFADLFEVKDAQSKKGDYFRRTVDDRLIPGCRRETLQRSTAISSSQPPDIGDNGDPVFRVEIPGHGQWATDLAVQLAMDIAGSGPPGRPIRQGGGSARLDAWIKAAPSLVCDHDSLRRTYQRSLVDLSALRFSTRTDPAHALPAAGLPSFMTVFGRDSILTSLQALLFNSELAATTLRALGERQGSRSDDFRDEDPGRIMHEQRFGELTAFEERPHSPYYGSADATPLYVVLLDEYEGWSGNTQLVRALEYQARAALEWMDTYADRQGSG